MAAMGKLGKLDLFVSFLSKEIEVSEEKRKKKNKSRRKEAQVVVTLYSPRQAASYQYRCHRATSKSRLSLIRAEHEYDITTTQ
jgi:hypothetical protein